MGLTQSDLAKLINISFSQIHKLETGVNQISVTQLYRIACALDVSIDYLFDYQGQEIAQPTNSRQIREFSNNLSHITDVTDLEIIGQIIRVLRVVQRPI